MARAIDQFRSSDITFWGIVALCCGGLAVMSANLSALVPPSVLAGLHATRLEGGTINQLRSQIANLQAETVRQKRENAELVSRFALAEQGSGEIARRVGAIEVSLPRIIEEAEAAAVDRSAVTAAISDSNKQSFDVEGGSVTIEQRPLLPEPAPAAPLAATSPVPAMPPIATAEPIVTFSPAPDVFGVVLGPPVLADNAAAAWDTLNRKIGTLLLGLTPLTADGEFWGRRNIVAGPFGDASEAAIFCRQVTLAGIACAPQPYLGTPLPKRAAAE